MEKLVASQAIRFTKDELDVSPPSTMNLQKALLSFPATVFAFGVGICPRGKMSPKFKAPLFWVCEGSLFWELSVFSTWVLCLHDLLKITELVGVEPQL